MSPIPYVQSAASQEVPPPYHFPGVTVNAFVWESNIAWIQAYCDRFFNLGDPKDRGFTYGPAAFWPYAVMLMIDYPVMISSSRAPEHLGKEVPYPDRGIVSQREVFVAVPVVRLASGAGAMIANSALEWALPFIVVGEPMSAVCGREMLGLEKLRASILMGEGRYPDSFEGQVILPGWSALDPGKTQQMQIFLDVQTGPPTPTFRGAPRPSSLFTLFRSPFASQAIGLLAAGSQFLDAGSAGAVPMSMETVALKQFRDAAQPERAVYQALVSCRAKYTEVANFRFYKEPDVELCVFPEGSFAGLVEYLALPPVELTTREGVQAYRFHPKAAYRFNATIDFDNMRTLHTFPLDRGQGLPPTPASSDLTAPWLRPWKGFFGPRRTP